MPENRSKPAPEKETMKLSTIGLIISFVMVLAFRGFVFETFHIPTGSMAPTLMGQHLRLHSPHSGFEWPVNAWGEQAPNGMVRWFAPQQVALDEEPQTLLPLLESGPALRGGDRIGVLKYNPLYQPERFHIVVLKWPATPRENYIKRLVGLPGERLWLVDGDLFVSRPHAPDDSERAWRIIRKPDDVQNALWWTVFSSEHTPLDPVHDGRTWRGPWIPDDAAAWDLSSRTYRFAGGEGALRFDTSRFPLTDWQPYNDAPVFRRLPRFPIADMRVRAMIEPDSTGTGVRFVVEARGQKFVAEIDPSGAASIRMGEADGEQAATLGATTGVTLTPGRATEVEFWHVDQGLQLWVDGERVLETGYDWGPIERLERSTTLSRQRIDGLEREGGARGNPLADPSIYLPASASISLSGGAATLHRVGLDRDIAWQPREYPPYSPLAGRPALGTHPANLPTLGGDEFFLLGDNSANSADSRLVDTIHPWVRERIDNNLGVVHRRMVTGRAVLVFWPAAQGVSLGGSRFNLIPDFGRMRFIR